MTEIIAADLMIPISKYPIVSLNDTLIDAIDEMDRIQIKSAGRLSLPRVVLVFDHDVELVGFLRRRDIFRGLEPGFLVEAPTAHVRKWFDVKIDPNLTEMTTTDSFGQIRKNARKCVRTIMLPITQTTEHDSHIMKILSLMVARNTSMIPVMKRDRVIGVVRSADVLHYIAHNILEVEKHVREH